MAIQTQAAEPLPRAPRKATFGSLGLALGLLITFAPRPLRADVELPAIFGNGMVLQCKLPIEVWGRAEPGEEVGVRLTNHPATTVAGEDGHWSVQMSPLDAGGSFSMIVRGHNELHFEDVWIGKVWLDAGQSNTAFPVVDSKGYDEVRAQADRPMLRESSQSSQSSDAPNWKGSGEWIVCAPDSVGRFT